MLLDDATLNPIAHPTGVPAVMGQELLQRTDADPLARAMGSTLLRGRSESRPLQ
jgi:hypothetical protein